MLLQYGKPKKQPKWWYIVDYFWGIFSALASLFVCLALWQFAYYQLGNMIMPDPKHVLSRAWQILQQHENSEMLKTFIRGLCAIMLSIAIGCLFGFLAALNKALAILLRPINTLLLGIPPIVWVVLAIFWFNMGNASVIFTVWIVTLPFIFASAQTSLAHIPYQLTEVAKVYQVPFSRQLRFLYIPYIFRQMLPALIVAIGSALKVTVMAELLGSNDGIGSAIATARAMLDTTDVFAYVLVILLIIMCIEYVILEPLRRYFIKGEKHVSTQ